MLAIIAVKEAYSSYASLLILANILKFFYFFNYALSTRFSPFYQKTGSPAICSQLKYGMIGHKDFAADQSVSHTCDKLDKEQYLPGIQSLLLLYSIDAAIGPLIASTFMKGMGVNGLFIYFIIVCTLLSLFIAVFHLRLSKRKFKNPEEEHIAISMGTAYVTPRMDPRVNQDADKNTIAKSS